MREWRAGRRRVICHNDIADRIKHSGVPAMRQTAAIKHAGDIQYILGQDHGCRARGHVLRQRVDNVEDPAPAGSAEECVGKDCPLAGQRRVERGHVRRLSEWGTIRDAGVQELVPGLVDNDQVPVVLPQRGLGSRVKVPEVFFFQFRRGGQKPQGNRHVAQLIPGRAGHGFRFPFSPLQQRKVFVGLQVP